MRPTVIDTADIRPSDQYEWYTAQLDEVFGISSFAIDTARGAYRGRIDVLSAPPLTYLHFNAENNGGLRLGQQIRRVEWGHYCIYRELGDGVVFELGGREFATSRGDLVIYDGDCAMRSRAKTTFDHGIWMVPRATLDLHLPLLPQPLVVHIPGATGMAGLALAYIEALAKPLRNLTEAEAALVADNLSRLIAMVCGAASRAHSDVTQFAKTEQLKQYIDAHLTVPDLDPEMAARALCISVRQLHLLFEPTGETFGQYLRRRRIQECRATLASPLSSGRSVTDIAFGWGFASLPTFYRAFQSEFGMAPGDVRAEG